MKYKKEKKEKKVSFESNSSSTSEYIYHTPQRKKKIISAKS